jgi:DNA-directed RNA polymerase specialized sigma24 family protein
MQQNATESTQKEAGPQVADLLMQASMGDQAAWDRIVDRYAGQVWAVICAHGLTGADAEDVSQVTWLLLVQHLDVPRDEEQLGQWLTAIATREAVRMHMLVQMHARAALRDAGPRSLPGAEADEASGCRIRPAGSIGAASGQRQGFRR